MIRKYATASLFLFFFLQFLLISFLVDLAVRDRRKKLLYFSKIGSLYAKIGLYILGIRVEIKNPGNLPEAEKNYLIVSNHLSYVDIFVIYSVIPSVFVANAELKEVFLLGTVTKFGGGVFVERRTRARLTEEIDVISKTLNEGFNVVLFPEGTTSDGERVRTFKTSFFAPAARAGTDILPVCIKYLKVNGEQVNRENRTSIFFYGDVTFFEHFFRLLSLKSVNVELMILDDIKYEPELDRKDSAELAYRRISSVYGEGL